MSLRVCLCICVLKCVLEFIFSFFRSVFAASECVSLYLRPLMCFGVCICIFRSVFAVSVELKLLLHEAGVVFIKSYCAPRSI